MTARLERISLDGQEFWVEVAEIEAPSLPVVQAASASAGASSADGKKTKTSSSGTKDGNATATVSKKTNTSVDGRGLAKRISTSDLESLVSMLVRPAREALDKIGPVKECAVEMSVGLKGEVGFFLAKGEANVALKLSVKW